MVRVQGEYRNYKFITTVKIESAELLPDNQKKLPWQPNNQYVYWGSLVSYLDETLNIDSEGDTLVSTTAAQHDSNLDSILRHCSAFVELFSPSSRRSEVL